MTFRRWGPLFGILCALSVGAADLHLHSDGAAYQDCAICHVADSGKIHSPALLEFGPPAPAVSEALPPPPAPEASAVSRSLPRSRAPPS